MYERNLKEKCYKMILILKASLFQKSNPRGVAASLLDHDIVVSGFELQSRYNVHF